MLDMKRKKSPRGEPIDPAYTTTQAGVRMGGLDTSTVWRLCRDGKLGYFKVGNRMKIRQSDIDRYLRKNTVSPTDEEETSEE